MDDMDKLIDNFILAGFLEVSGIDSNTGEFLYGFTKKFEETNPNLFNEFQNAISNQILSLWAEGFLEIYMNEDDEPMVSLTEKSTDIQAIEKLGPQQQDFLLFIITKFQE